MIDVIERFYKSFAEQDAEGMVDCYSDDIIFEDPAFGKLEGIRAKNMWRMLCASQKGQDFKIEASNFMRVEEWGSAHWEARYTFSKTGRRVHNKVDARFLIRDQKIVHHRDAFNLYRWSKQALGITGVLIGWTPFFKKKLQVQTNQMLDKFEQRNPSVDRV